MPALLSDSLGAPGESFQGTVSELGWMENSAGVAAVTAYHLQYRIMFVLAICAVNALCHQMAFTPRRVKITMTARHPHELTAMLIFLLGFPRRSGEQAPP